MKSESNSGIVLNSGISKIIHSTGEGLSCILYGIFHYAACIKGYYGVRIGETEGRKEEAHRGHSDALYTTNTPTNHLYTVQRCFTLGGTYRSDKSHGELERIL